MRRAVPIDGHPCAGICRACRGLGVLDHDAWVPGLGWQAVVVDCPWCAGAAA